MKEVMNKQLKILLYTDALVLLSSAMIVPFYTVYVDKIGGDILDAGIAASVFAIAAGLASLVSGKMTDSIKRKERIIAFSYLAMAVGFVGYLFVNTVWQLLIAQVVIGLAQAFYAPAYDALYSKHIKIEKAGSAWGMWESLYYFTIAIGTGVGAVLIYFVGFEALFIGMAALCLVSSLRLFVLPKKIM